MLALDFNKKAKKFLAQLPPKQKKQLAEKIQNLRLNPRPHDSKNLSGHPPQILSTSSGEYRVIYSFDDVALRILIIGKRNDDAVYKALKNKNFH